MATEGHQGDDSDDSEDEDDFLELPGFGNKSKKTNLMSEQDISYKSNFLQNQNKKSLFKKTIGKFTGFAGINEKAYNLRFKSQGSEVRFDSISCYPIMILGNKFKPTKVYLELPKIDDKIIIKELKHKIKK